MIPILEGRNPVLLLLLLLRHAQGTPPPLDSETGLESSGRRLISSIGKTKINNFKKPLTLAII